MGREERQSQRDRELIKRCLGKDLTAGKLWGQDGWPPTSLFPRICNKNALGLPQVSSTTDCLTPSQFTTGTGWHNRLYWSKLRQASALLAYPALASPSSCTNGDSTCVTRVINERLQKTALSLHLVGIISASLASCCYHCQTCTSTMDGTCSESLAACLRQDTLCLYNSQSLTPQCGLISATFAFQKKSCL